MNNNPNKTSSFSEQYFSSYVTTGGFKYDFNENSNDLIERISSMASYIVSEYAKFIVGEIYKIN